SGERRSRQHHCCCCCRQDESDLHHQASSLGLMPPGPRDSWTEGTPHFHSACYEGALSGIGGCRANPRTRITPGAETPFRVPAAPEQECHICDGMALFPGSPRHNTCTVPWFSPPAATLSNQEADHER